MEITYTQDYLNLQKIFKEKGDVAKFDFCRISTSPFSYSFFWLSRLAAIFFAS